jgi:hypothetical protein
MMGRQLLFVLGLLAIPASVEAKNPSDEVLGIRVGMPMQESARRLEKLGLLAPGESADSKKQYWRLKDSRFANLVVRFDKESRVQWVTAFARQGGRPVRFTDVGDLKRARQAGKYIYLWEIEPRGDRQGYQVIARGLDPNILNSVSLTGLGSAKRIERTSSSATVR